ncbi:MAG: HTH domain-containing protein, partial [Myxococcota bacterium]
MTPRDRQDAIVGWLRGRSCTAAELAERLSVSERTVRRDLATLRERGIQIHADAGPGGGLRVDTSPRRADLGLDELLGLAVQLAVAEPGPFRTAAERALGKILGTLPLARAQRLRKLLGRVV